jgi:hypothetical protein
MEGTCMIPRIPSILAFLAAALLAAPGYGSETRVKLKDLPVPVQKTVQEQSKGATLRGLSKEVEHGKTFYEAELKVNGHNRDVLIGADGAVVEIEEEVPLASLPAPVNSALKKAAGEGKILSVESITEGGAVTAYEARIQHAGKTSEVKVDPDGKIKK